MSARRSMACVAMPISIQCAQEGSASVKRTYGISNAGAMTSSVPSII
jgi:hypothetical protein